MHDARFTAGDSWHGDGGRAFRASAATAGQYVSDVAAKMHAVSAALTDFAGELDVVKSQMADARSAAASGLTVVGTQIQMPTGPTADSPTVTAGWANETPPAFLPATLVRLTRPSLARDGPDPGEVAFAFPGDQRVSTSAGARWEQTRVGRAGRHVRL